MKKTIKAWAASKPRSRNSVIWETIRPSRESARNNLVHFYGLWQNLKDRGYRIRRIAITVAD